MTEVVKVTNTWKFIPYSAAKTNNPTGKYSRRKLMSFNCHVNMVIGARRMGKTFTFREQVFNSFLEKGEKFVWMRDNDEARKKLSLNNGANFFKNWQSMRLNGFESGEIRGEVILINGKTAGYLQPSSTFQNYKGSEYNDITTICYDEFIKELNRNKNANEAWEIINSMYTIMSTRENGRILMTANALDKGNSFLSVIGLNVKEYGFYINREKSICLHYADNHPKFKEQQKKSIVGRLIVGTSMESNLFDSEFIGESDLYFQKLPSKSKIYIIIDDLSIRIYRAQDCFYVIEDFNSDSYEGKRYAYDMGQARVGVPYLSKVHRQWIKFAMENNMVLYHTPFIRKKFLDNFKF